MIIHKLNSVHYHNRISFLKCNLSLWQITLWNESYCDNKIKNISSKTSLNDNFAQILHDFNWSLVHTVSLNDFSAYLSGIWSYLVCVNIKKNLITQIIGFGLIVWNVNVAIYCCLQNMLKHNIWQSAQWLKWSHISSWNICKHL